MTVLASIKMAELIQILLILFKLLKMLPCLSVVRNNKVKNYLYVYIQYDCIKELSKPNGKNGRYAALNVTLYNMLLITCHSNSISYKLTQFLADGKTPRGKVLYKFE